MFKFTNNKRDANFLNQVPSFIYQNLQNLKKEKKKKKAIQGRQMCTAAILK